MKDLNFISIFEKQLANYTGAKEAVVVNSCSNALFLSLLLCKKILKNIDVEQEIPNQTYISVPTALLHTGFEPKILDKYWAGFYQIGNLPVIDSAQYFTSGMCKETIKATKAKFCCVSFGGESILSIGTGGAILTNSSKCAKYLRRLAFDGRDYTKNIKDDNPILGYHMNMTQEQVAKGILLLNKLPQVIESNRTSDEYQKLSEMKIFKKYHEN